MELGRPFGSVARACGIGARIAGTILLCASVASCVLRMPTAEEMQRAARKDYEERERAAAAEHAALRKTWYGQIVIATYVRTEDGTAQQREVLDTKALQNLVAPIVKKINRSIQQHSGESSLAARFQVNARNQKPISVEIVEAGIYVRPHCASRTVTIPARFFLRLSTHVLTSREPGLLDDLSDELKSRLVGRDLSQDHVFGSYAAALLGPAPSANALSELKSGLAMEGAAIWNALAFVISHEAAHIWTSQCDRVADDEQRKREAAADTLGVMLALESFGFHCGSAAKFDSRRLIAALDGSAMPDGGGSDEARDPEAEAVEQLASLIAATTYHYDGRSISGGEIATGMSGVTLMLESVGDFVGTDESHPEGKERTGLDDAVRTEFIHQLLAQDIRKANRALIVRLIRTVSDLTIADLVAENGGQFSPQMHLRDGLACFTVEFNDDERY